VLHILAVVIFASRLALSMKLKFQYITESLLVLLMMAQFFILMQELQIFGWLRNSMAFKPF